MHRPMARPPRAAAYAASLSAALLVLASCSGTAQEVTGPEEPTELCTFANPIGTGQDPYVVLHEGAYYLVESRDNALYVYRSDDLTDLKQNGVRVWEPPAEGWNRTHLWAPELHQIDGRWYIYYAAGEDGPPFIYQRSGVLASAGADPQGTYEDLGPLYTGDTGADSVNVWAIDVTVGEVDDQLYAVWSGWEENRDTDRTPQHLYIAEMANPWTISSDRVKLSSPVEPWEVGTQLDLNEGPQFLMHGDDTFIIYSARESWLPAYRLGQLRLEDDADPMDPANWTKTGPVFQATSTVFGVGHASFTTSPDGTEDWIVYHAKVSEAPGWEREIRTQPFTWTADGSPSFGSPVASRVQLDQPSGQCE